MEKRFPLPTRATRPRPVMLVLPQFVRFRLRFRVGWRERVVPVHARRALRLVSFQSVVPVRWRTASEVEGELGEMRAVMGVVVVRRW